MSTIYLIVVSALLIALCSCARGQDSYDFVFPGRDNRDEQIRDLEIDDGDSEFEIPLDLAKQISLAENFEDILNIIGGTEDSDKPEELSNRFAGSLRFMASYPKPVSCKPIPTAILLAEESTSLTLGKWEYILPKCIWVDRCSGCFVDSRMTCEPSQTEEQHIQARRWKPYHVPEKVIIPVEVHKECYLACAVTAKDCNFNQAYNESACSCVCTNTDDKKKCERKDQHELKTWNPKTCECECNKKRECSTGLIWDKIQCGCVKSPERKRISVHTDAYHPTYLGYYQRPNRS